VIEANRVGGGATGASLGVLSTPAAGAGFGDPDHEVHGRARKVWHRERLAAQRYLLRLIEESRADCDLNTGAVLLAPGRKDFEALAATIESRNAFYGTSDYMLEAAELDSEAGGRVAEHFAGGLVMSEAHYVQPAKMIEGLAALARRLGAVICERTEVVALRASDGRFRLITNGGDTVARDVVLATGGYSRELNPWLRQRTLPLPSIVAVTEELPEGEVRDVCRSGRVLLVNRYRSYLCRPTPDGRRLVLGGPVGQVPGTAAENVAGLHQYFIRLFPDLRGIEFTHCWTAMIAATRDAKGHAGRHAGAWYAVGASGIVSCADAGRRMAQNILHKDDTAAEDRFPSWPLRDSETLLWQAIVTSTRLLDLLGRSRLR